MALLDGGLLAALTVSFRRSQKGEGSAMPESRKLAAILAADVSGYSKLAAADEERTLARLRALRSDLMDPTIALITAASLSGRAMASSSSSEASSIPFAAP
jgi:hypothetical protein